MTNQLYIANLGKYNEGILQGEWFTFPIDMDEVAEVIGLNSQYEEWAIHDYEFDFPLSIGENVNIDNLNEFIEEIENNRGLSELFEVMQKDQYNTDRIAEIAISVIPEHDIVHDDSVNAMVKNMIDDSGYESVKNFLYNANSNSVYHIIDGYGNLERLTVEYLENLVSEYIDELKQGYRF